MIINRDSDDIDIHSIYLLIKAAYAQYCKGDYQKALESYQNIISSGHRWADAFWGVGVCYKVLGNLEAAESSAQEALLIKPDHFRSLQLLASITISQGEKELIYEYVLRVLSCIPRSAAENSPRLANFTRKVAKYTYSGDPEDYVEEMLGLEEEDRIWIAWAREFKSDYEANHPDKV